MFVLLIEKGRGQCDINENLQVFVTDIVPIFFVVWEISHKYVFSAEITKVKQGLRKKGGVVCNFTPRP